MKARPVAGELAFGWRLARQIDPMIYRPAWTSRASTSIREMKERIEREHANAEQDVKIGAGGIRDVEFVAQALQLLHGGRMPQVRGRSAPRALVALAEAAHLARDARRAAGGLSLSAPRREPAPDGGRAPDARAAARTAPRASASRARSSPAQTRSRASTYAWTKFAPPCARASKRSCSAPAAARSCSISSRRRRRACSPRRAWRSSSARSRIGSRAEIAVSPDPARAMNNLDSLRRRHRRPQLLLRAAARPPRARPPAREPVRDVALPLRRDRAAYPR